MEQCSTGALTDVNGPWKPFIGCRIVDLCAVSTTNDLLHYRHVYGFLAVIGAGAILLGIIQAEVSNDRVDEMVVLCVSMLKSILFFRLLFRRISATAEAELGMRNALAFIVTNLALFLLSYAFDFLSLYQVNELSFRGVPLGDGLFSRAIAFLYFSVVTFSTAGFGDIAPATNTARLLTSTELLLSYGLTVLVIANFTGLRRALTKNAQ